jgi:hypothetical protein
MSEGQNVLCLLACDSVTDWFIGSCSCEGLCLHLQGSGSPRKILIACLLKIKSSQTLETVHYTHTMSCSSFNCSGSPVKFHCYISVLCAEYFGPNSNLHWHQLHYIFWHFVVEIICVLILSKVKQIITFVLNLALVVDHWWYIQGPYLIE